LQKATRATQKALTGRMWLTDLVFETPVVNEHCIFYLKQKLWVVKLLITMKELLKHFLLT